jgi:hypothetical protein
MYWNFVAIDGVIKNQLQNKILIYLFRDYLKKKSAPQTKLREMVGRLANTKLEGHKVVDTKHLSYKSLFLDKTFNPAPPKYKERVLTFAHNLLNRKLNP